MQLEAIRHRYEEMHKDKPWHDGYFRNWSAQQTPYTFYRYDHGVTIWLSREDLTPDDDWLGQGVSASSESDG